SSLTKASDCRDDTKILMQPYANWEDYLTPIPMSIALLGELVFISSNVDFSIRQGSPEGGFKHVKYPDSFRACLMQVCNAGWRAFNEAHKNMDQIRLHTSNIPSYIKTAEKVLSLPDDAAIEAILPLQLEEIDDIANKCLKLSESTEVKFTDALELIQELLESCTSAKETYGKELEEVRKKIEEAKLREKAAREANRWATEAFKNMSKQLDEAHKSFTKSMASMPSGWEVIGMNFVEGLTNTITTVLSGVTSIVCGNPFAFMGSPFAAVAGFALGPKNNPVAASNIFSKSSQILSLVQGFSSFIDKDQIKWSEVTDQHSGAPQNNWLNSILKNVQMSISTENECEPKRQALEICTNALNISSELGSHAPGAEPGDAKTKELVQAMKGLTEAAQVFDTRSKAATNTSAFNIKPPQLFKAQSVSSGSSSKGHIVADNARFRIEQSRAQLDKVRELYEKSVETLEKNQQELTEILVTMRNCEVKEIDLTTTLKFLAQGLEAMGRVKEQWQKLVRFFQMVCNIVKTCLTSSLKDFVNTGQGESETKIKYSSKMFLRDVIYNQAFHLSIVASLLHMISSTYTQVSSQYLMDSISTLSRLMSLDPSKPEFLSERKRMNDACDNAQKVIKQLVQKNKLDFDEKTRARFKKIETDLKAVLPPAPEEDTKQLQEIVASEFKDTAK
ncbi:uncharacterized protein LOC118770731, partial [Megalops cyprinoides]|uniref:uncharacterized protein LOC118770731 n=1 Tax=Megalops cyprinoides TaxID=118141 RepID=UPI00186485A2